MKTTKTVSEWTCDGKRGRCGKRLINTLDGIVVYGSLSSPNGAIVLPPPEGGETARCWPCFYEETGAPERIKTVYEERIVYQDRSSGYNGPSGPLPPPELPHHVRVAAALCGV